MIAIIKTGGKQYKVKAGDKLKVEKLTGDEGSDIELDTLLKATGDGKEVEIGKPLLDNKTKAKIIEQGLDKKVTVVKYKNKTRYLRTKGHRQAYTKIEINDLA